MITRYGTSVSPCGTLATMSKYSVSPSGERTSLWCFYRESLLLRRFLLVGRMLVGFVIYIYIYIYIYTAYPSNLYWSSSLFLFLFLFLPDSNLLFIFISFTVFFVYLFLSLSLYIYIYIYIYTLSTAGHIVQWIKCKYRKCFWVKSYWGWWFNSN